MPRRLKTTQTSIEIVELLKELDGATITELHSELGLAKSAIHGHLKTLEEKKLIIKEANTYHIGLRLLHYGEYARRRKPEYSLAEQKVNKLADVTQEGADFCVEEHNQMITLFNHINTSGDPAFNVGRIFHMHNSATGKAILAEYSDEDIRKIINQQGLTQETEKTIHTEDDLVSEIERIREQGYAFNDEESLIGLRGVGAVVKRPDSSIVGALSVGGPSYRVKGTKLRSELPNHLMAATDELENEIAAHYLPGEN